MSQQPQVDHGDSPALPAERAAAPAASTYVKPPTTGTYVKPHANHGNSPARVIACAISGVGFLIGGVAFPFHVWPVVYVGGALQIVAAIVVVAMNAAGYGVPDVWGELKAEARARNPRVEPVGGYAFAGTGLEPKAEAQVKELSTQRS
jgi:hypothetical protein